jgi:hypothetical protein
MSSDTSPEAARVQAEVHRRLTAAQKLEIACQLSAFVRAFLYERIRDKNPNLDHRGVIRELIWQLYGIRVPVER